MRAAVREQRRPREGAQRGEQLRPAAAGQRRGKTVCFRRSAGEKGCDIIIDDPEGVLHSLEVKTVASLTPAHLKQARTNGSKECRRWALVWFPAHYGTAHRQALLLRHRVGEATPAWEIIAEP